ncbi:MAG: Binding-protein-dependent transport system inner rane component [Betaproteobacteria bacterium]|nr:Binding-protein-dependent transport system inner rane component [Betaproteobacteria bacterium]
MNFSPVLLITDVLLWLLVFAVVGYVWYVRRHEHLLVPWLKVRQNPVAMICATVLVAYAAIGLADSLHFRTASGAPGRSQTGVEVRSVLDVLLGAALGPMAGKSEKTYSAPLAIYSFAKETVEKPGGGQAREFPRLTVGGAHLKNPGDRDGDIAWRGALGLAKGLVLFAVLNGALALWVGRKGGGPALAARAMWRGTTPAPWRPILVTLLLICLMACPAVALGSHYHLFGTDKVGQDVLTISLKSIRTGLVIGTLTTMVMLPFAVLLGLAAGYFRGWVDDVIVYLYTSLSSIPSVLLIAAAVLIVQVSIDNHQDLFPTTLQRADMRLLALCVILGATGWTGLCRLLRGEALKLRELDYIQAAQAFGVARLRILTRHMLPNVMHLVTINAVMDFSGMVLAEAVLSYVGVGVDPTTNSFGGMINAARFEMSRDPLVWWLLAAAFFFMLGLVLAANLFADAVQEAFDPRRVVRRARPRIFQRGPVGGMTEAAEDPRAPGGRPA